MTDILPLPTSLTLARYQMTFVPHSPLDLPAFKEPLLRGGLGTALKQGACIRPTGTLCASCAAPDICPYAYLFESRPPVDAQVLRAANAIPLPYLFAAPNGHQSLVTGEPFPFTLTLVGGAIRYFPYLVAALRVLGLQGLGSKRVRATLGTVHWLGPAGTMTPLFSGTLNPTLRTQPPALPLSAWVAALPNHPPINRLTLAFDSPIALKHQGRTLRGAPPFHVIIRALLRRLSALAAFYGDARWDLDYRGWIERAEAVDLSAAQTRWVERVRKASRTQQLMPLSGIMGRATYIGDFTPFLPLLHIGTLLHVGNNTVFGNGRYTITINV
jgi:hypothetical protein